VAPRRRAEIRDRERVRARARFAVEEKELARSELKAAGLDPERLDKLAKERAKTRRQLAEDGRRKAIEGSAAAARRLADLHALIIPADPIDIVVDEVSSIRSFIGQGELHDWNIAPGDNRAKYTLRSNDDAWDGTGRLSFFTLWQNPKGRAVIINAGASLTVNAHISADASWNGVAAWFVDDSEARATVRARTTVWRMDSSVSSIVADQNLGSTAAHGGFFGDDDDIGIEFDGFLAATGVQVPADAFVLIEAELFTEWYARDGSIHLDANSGDYQVSLPQLTLTLT
jgi:hypothetical protein